MISWANIAKVNTGRPKKVDSVVSEPSFSQRQPVRESFNETIRRQIDKKPQRKISAEKMRHRQVKKWYKQRRNLDRLNKLDGTDPVQLQCEQCRNPNIDDCECEVDNYDDWDYDDWGYQDWWENDVHCNCGSVYDRYCIIHDPRFQWRWCDLSPQDRIAINAGKAYIERDGRVQYRSYTEYCFYNYQ